MEGNYGLCGGGRAHDRFVNPTDTHQFLGPSSSHTYCKKGIPYSQALRLSGISCDNERLDKCFNDLKGQLMERDYNGKMIRKQI